MCALCPLTRSSCRKNTSTKVTKLRECQITQLTPKVFAFMQIISLPNGLAMWDALFSLVDPNLFLVTLDFIKV